MKKDTQYLWGGESALREVVTHVSSDRKHSAILYAPEGQEHQQQLSGLQDTLVEEFGIRVYPKNVNGKSALIAYGYADDTDLLGALHQAGFVKGIAQENKIDNPYIEPSEKKGLSLWFEEFRHNNSMKTFGYLGLAGNILLATTAFLEDDVKERLPIAGLYIANCALYAYYGSGAHGIGANDALDNMNAFLADNGIDLRTTPVEEALEKIENDRSLGRKIDQYVGDNVITINEGIGAVNNLLMINNGISRGITGEGGFMFTAGMASLFGSLFAIFAKEEAVEDQKATDEQDAGPLDGMIKQMKAHPLAVLSVANYVQNFAFVGEAFKRFQMVTNPEVQQDIIKEGNSLREQYQKSASVVENLARDNTGANWADKIKDATQANAELGGKVDANNKAQMIMGGGDKMWQIPAAVAGIFLLCTTMSLVSSKNSFETSDPKREYEEIFARAAQSAVQFPKGPERDETIHMMSVGLASQECIKKMAANEIADFITELTEDLEKNPLVSKLEQVQAPQHESDVVSTLRNQMNEQSDVEQTLRGQLKNQIPDAVIDGARHQSTLADRAKFAGVTV